MTPKSISSKNTFYFRLILLITAANLIGCEPTNTTNTTTTHTTSPTNVPPPTSADTNSTSSRNNSTEASTLPSLVKGELPANEAQKIIESIARQAVEAIAAKNYTALSAMTDPAKGLRFTPYTYITGKEVVLNPQELAAGAGSPKKYHWGEFDGSGEPIDLSINDYFARFVYNYNYAQKAKTIGYNQRIGKGNSVNNQREKHPNAIIVEYHIPQNDPKFEGMDWGSLYLIFEQDAAAQWKLVNVAHGQWTS